MKNKYVLHIPSWFPIPENNVLGIFTEEHIFAAKQTGFQQFVLYLHTSDMLANFQLKEDSAYISIKGKWNKLLVFWRILKVLRKNTGSPSCIHLHVSTCFHAFVALVLGKVYCAKIVVTEHWTGFRTGKYALLPYWRKIISKRIIRKAFAVTTVSSFLRADMQVCGLEGHFEILPNILQAPSKAVSVNNAKNESPNVLMVADMVDENKNISGFIKAFNLFQVKYPTAKANIVGGGIDLERITKMASSNSNITVHGAKPHSFVYKLFSKTDFYVCASYVETFSVSVAEALMHGKPVVTTKCGGPEGFVSENNGFVCKEASVIELEVGMEHVWRNYEKYNPVEIASFTEKQFGLNTVVHKLQSIYQRVSA